MDIIIFDAVASIATLGALVAAIWQLYVGNRDRRASERSSRADRAMRMFEDVVAGTPTAEAFHRLSVYLRHVGSAAGAVTWYLPTDSDLSGEGVFAPVDQQREQEFADLYTVLWFFERAEASIQSKVVDADATFDFLGFHMWWWGQVLRNLHGPKATAALARLAVWAQRRAEVSGALADWISRCTTDFAGGPAVEFAVNSKPPRENRRREI